MKTHKNGIKMSKSDRDTLNKVLEAYTNSWDYTQNNYHDTWEKAWKLYNNKRVDRAYDGISDTFVPMVFSTIESMVSSLAGSRPRFDFQPTKPEQENDTQILNSLIDFYWESDQWQSKVDKWLRSMLMYGTGVMYVWWDIDRPCASNVPIRDFFVDPTATNPNDASYMGRRYLTTKENLEGFEYVDPDTGKMVKIYKNLKKIKSWDTGNSDQTDKEEKEIFLGSTLGKDAKHKQVEVIEYWTKDRVICVANRSVVIRDDENPYKEALRLQGEDNASGIIPFVVQRNYQDESLFYGKGDVEPIMGLQESLNDMTNQKRDAVTYKLNPMFTLDPQYSDQLESVESLPGAIYPFEAGALQPVIMGDIPASAYNEEAIIKQDIRETTAADLTFKGAETDTDKTATEISAQLAQANQRLALKVSQVENEGYHDLAKLVLSMVQIYVDEPQIVRVIGRNSAIEWEIFDPELFNGEYEPNVQLRSTVDAKKEAKVAETKEMYAAFLGDPAINQMELKRIAMQKVWDLDEDEIEALLTPDEQMAMAGEMGMPQGGIDVGTALF